MKNLSKITLLILLFITGVAGNTIAQSSTIPPIDPDRDGPKVKTQTVWTTSLSGFDSDNSRKKSSYRAFDLEGKIVEQVIYDMNGKPTQWKRDPADESTYSMIKGLTESAGLNEADMQFTYNDSGLVTRIDVQDGRGNPFMHQDFEYDDLNRPTSRVFATENGVFYQKFEYAYSPEGKLILMNQYENPNEISLAWGFLYDENDNMVETNSKYADGRLRHQNLIEYNAKNQVLRNANYNESNILVSEQILEYDAAGKNTRSTTKYPAAGFSTSSEMRYNDFGDLAEMKQFNKLGDPIQITEIEYTYFD